MVAIIISIASSIVSGMVLFFLQRFFKRKEDNDKKRDEAKRRENILILKSIEAVGKLTYADAIAIRDGKTNGEMKAAVKAYNEANEELYNFLLEQSEK
jgi:membrane protein implicated in regulation of membrane protease activity